MGHLKIKTHVIKQVIKRFPGEQTPVISSTTVLKICSSSIELIEVTLPLNYEKLLVSGFWQYTGRSEFTIPNFKRNDIHQRDFFKLYMQVTRFLKKISILLKYSIQPFTFNMQGSQVVRQKIKGSSIVSNAMGISASQPDKELRIKHLTIICSSKQNVN